jgi:heme-degrading monooxygenase HmoA
MVTYVATLYAKHGSETDVAQFYQDMEAQLNAAPGFRQRTILRAKPGTMFAIVKPMLSEEQLASNREPPHPEGVHFVMIEEWDSAEDRVKFSRGQDKSRAAKLYPHLLPQHTHEFYEDISPAS